MLSVTYNSDITLMNKCLVSLISRISIAEKYNSLRKECKRFYLLSFGIVEFNVRWIRCSLYCVTDYVYYNFIKNTPHNLRSGQKYDIIELSASIRTPGWSTMSRLQLQMCMIRKLLMI